MAENESKGLYGHKIFFLYPSRYFQTDMIERLHTLEYEVYIIQDLKNVKNILFKNRDSILYVNLDNYFNTASWINYVKTLEEIDSYASIKFGFITERADSATLKMIEVQTRHEGGILKFEDNQEENLRTLIKQLDSLDARGRRQYVRANCFDDESAEVFWVQDNIMYKLKIIDISAAGIAVKIPPKQANSLKPGQFISNINLMLKAKPMPVNVSVYAIKQGQGATIGVLMVDRTTDKKTLDKIRKYVSETLDKKLQKSIYGMEADRTNYTVSENFFKKSTTELLANKDTKNSDKKKDNKDEEILELLEG